MPPTIHHRVDRAYPGSVFAIVNWKGFLGALAQNYATVTGTLEEVETSYGTGLRVAAANSYVQFDWTSQAPLTIDPRSIFIRFLTPNVAANQSLAAWGNPAVARDSYSLLIIATPVFRAGYDNGDWDEAGTPVNDTWYSYSVTNEGINGGANIVYVDGGDIVTGANGAAAVTSYTDLTLFARSDGSLSCPVGTIIQEVIVFNTVRSLADILLLHEKGIGAA